MLDRPVRVRRGEVGIVELSRRVTLHVSTVHRLLATLADETGVAAQNARLFSGLRNANQQMEDMNRDLERAVAGGPAYPVTGEAGRRALAVAVQVMDSVGARLVGVAGQVTVALSSSTVNGATRVTLPELVSS